MYMTYIWKGPTMSTPQNLQAEVLDALQHGAHGNTQDPTAFTNAGGDFENIQANKVRAFIITPNGRLTVDPGFDDL